MRVPGWFGFVVGGALLLCSCDRETQVDRANREGVLLVGNSAEPKALDPQLVTGVIESKVLTSLFEGLCADHPSQDDADRPGAAERWEHNEDFTEWTFYLQPEGKWSDEQGTPVTAHDFDFAYHRMLHPELAAPYAEMLYFIRNAEKFNKGEIADWGEVGMEVIDDFTFKVRLREPVPFLPSITRHYTWFPIPRHVVLKHCEKHFYERFTEWSEIGNLVGNGPFKLKEWRYNGHIEVERNPHYWDAANVKLNGIRYYPIENPYTETRAFLAGQLHTQYQLPADMIDKMAETYPQLLRQEPYVGTVFVRLNVTREPLRDERVRHAMSCAINRELLCEHVFTGYLPAGRLTPKMGAYEPPAPLKFDPEEGRRLLAEAGYPDGEGFPRLSILISRPSARNGAEAVQEMWRQHLGIIVDIKNLDWGSYITAQQTLQFDIAVAGWIGDYLDPTTFLGMWTEGNGNNNTGWSSETYERLLAEAAVKPDPAARLATLTEAENLFIKELPILPVAWYSRNYLHRPEVKGWHPLLLDNHPWKDISLEP